MQGLRFHFAIAACLISTRKTLHIWSVTKTARKELEFWLPLCGGLDRMLDTGAARAAGSVVDIECRQLGRLLSWKWKGKAGAILFADARTVLALSSTAPCPMQTSSLLDLVGKILAGWLGEGGDTEEEVWGK